MGTKRLTKFYRKLIIGIVVLLVGGVFALYRDKLINSGFPTIYDEKYCRELTQTNYDYQKRNLYTYFEQRVTDGEMLDGFIMSEWTPVESYLDIPHSRLIDQENSGEETIFTVLQ